MRALDTLSCDSAVTFFVGENGSGKSTLEIEYADRAAWAKGLAMGPAHASLAALEQRYGIDLDANSHGQSFLRLFQSRFVPGGLYLLDEPEAPLSLQSQLGLMAMMQDMIAQDAQFIVATHSPILLACPGATIYRVDSAPAEVVTYDELEHVRLTRDFLNAPAVPARVAGEVAQLRQDHRKTGINPEDPQARGPIPVPG